MNSQIHIVGMQASSKPVEDQIRKLFENREGFKASLPKEVLDKVRIIKNKCYQAEQEEYTKFGGSLDNSWRKSNNNSKNSSPITTPRPSNGVPLAFRSGKSTEGSGNVWGNNSKGSTQSSFPSTPKKEEGKKEPYQPSGYNRYVSKFSRSDNMDNQILNNLILSKLNRFSTKNYSEIKSFIQQVLDSDDKEFLKAFLLLVFKKAASEISYCPLYAKLLSELQKGYKSLHDEMMELYYKYIEIFKEVGDESNDESMQQMHSKEYRLGYSQFLAELTSLHVLTLDDLMKIYDILLMQTQLLSEKKENNSVVEDCIECLYRITTPFSTKENKQLSEMRDTIALKYRPMLQELIDNQKQKYPGLSKKAQFRIMDVQDFFPS